MSKYKGIMSAIMILFFHYFGTKQTLGSLYNYVNLPHTEGVSACCQTDVLHISV